MLSSNQRIYMYFPQPITNQSSEMKTNFSPKLSTSKSSLNGYILVLRYAGQQGGGVKSLVSLQRWVRDVSLPLTIVEPFVQDSFLGTYRKSFQELKFSDMFDLENFNRVSHREGVPGLIPWETYINRAPGRAVLVRIVRGASPTPTKVLWNARPGSSDCWQLQNRDKAYNITINKRCLCYVRVVDYFQSSLSNISAGEVRSIFFDGLELTTMNLVFDLWSVTKHIASAHSRPVSPYFSDRLSTSYMKNGSVFLTHKLQESHKILLDVKNYQEQFLFGGPSYVAVMLRTEYILLKQRSAKGNINLTQVQELLDETVNVTTVVMAGLGIKDIFVASDVGVHGSITWGGTLNSRVFHNEEKARVDEQIKNTMGRLYKNKWTFEKWEKSFAQATGGVKDRGYIAAVQRGIASQASCLIMLGGGSFQYLTLKSYVGHTEPHKRCIRLVGTNIGFDVKKLYALKNISR